MVWYEIHCDGVVIATYSVDPTVPGGGVRYVNDNISIPLVAADCVDDEERFLRRLTLDVIARRRLPDAAISGLQIVRHSEIPLRAALEQAAQRLDLLSDVLYDLSSEVSAVPADNGDLPQPLWRRLTVAVAEIQELAESLESVHAAKT